MCIVNNNIMLLTTLQAMTDVDLDLVQEVWVIEGEVATTGEDQDQGHDHDPQCVGEGQDHDHDHTPQHTRGGSL